MKPWKTVLEDQTMKAQAQIKHLLKKEGEESSSKKGVAFAMASVGILLIIIGIFPFFSSQDKDSLKADINLQAVIPAFEENTPTTTGSVSFNPDPIPVDINETTIEPINHIAIPTSTSTTIEDIFTETAVEPVTVENVNIEPINTTSQTPFRVNTHTGTIDEDQKIEDEIIDNRSTTSEKEENLHSAAPKTVKTGPEMWLIAFFSLFLAFFVRRKRQFVNI